MPIVLAKCTNCGATLKVDSSKDAAICPFCESAYIVEKAINNYNVTNNISANVVNVYGGNYADFVITAGKLIKYHGASSDVVIPDNVTIIGKEAFANCSGLKSITIPDTARQTILITKKTTITKKATDTCTLPTSTSGTL